MTEFLWIFFSTLAVGALACLGLLTFALNDETFKKVINLLVAFAAGTLIGASFIHLIPEAMHKLGGGHGKAGAPLLILSGFVFFLVLEQYLCWHHCHRAPSEHSKTPFSFMILIANGIHNFVDGILVGASFLVSIPLGITTAIAVAAHEVPQELGNFGILVYGGWDKLKALVVNLAVSLIIIPGGIAAYLSRGLIDPIFLVPFAAGGFIYIGAVDLIPEIKKCGAKGKRKIPILFFLLGIIFMQAVELFVPH